MTATELQTRTEKSQFLPVTSVGSGIFYVESEQGNICYRVEVTDRAITCTCADYAKNCRRDLRFRCKHILAMLGIEPDDIVVARYLERNRPKLADCWITNIKGKEFVLYAGLLDLAHQKGLLKLEVEVVQYPAKENGNEAICRAVAVSRLGEVYADIGDANSNNTAPMIAKHLLRMASTRAKARVLRDFSNIGMTALEELGDFDDITGKETRATKSTRKKASVTNIESSRRKSEKSKTEKNTNTDQSRSKPDTDKKVEEMKNTDNTVAHAKNIQSMSPAQSNAIINLAQRRGITEDELSSMVHQSFNIDDYKSLSSIDAGTLIRQLQQSA